MNTEKKVIDIITQDLDWFEFAKYVAKEQPGLLVEYVEKLNVPEHECDTLEKQYLEQLQALGITKNQAKSLEDIVQKCIERKFSRRDTIIFLRKYCNVPLTISGNFIDLFFDKSVFSENNHLLRTGYIPFQYKYKHS